MTLTKQIASNNSMNKNLILPLLLIIFTCCSATASKNYYSGLFEITDLKLPPDAPRNEFEKMAKRYLGTKIQLNIYDNTAIFCYMRDEERKFVLDKDEEDRYSYRDEEEEELYYIILQLNRTCGEITSINITLNKGEGDCTLTAKVE